MLEIRELCLQAGGFHVDRINFAVAAGSCHALVGETGSGKTLVLETVAGLRKAKSGGIHWLGRDIMTLPAEERHIAYVPQDLALFPHMTVRENIEYGLWIQKNTSEDKFAELDKLIRALGINHLLERSIRNLSGGERQRIALARALAPGNKLLLLDEPFSALHESMRKELWLLLKSLQQQLGITILIVTHDMEEAFFLADSVTFIACGKIVQSGDKRQVYRYPTTVEAAKFFGVQNLFPAEVVEGAVNILTLHCPILGMTLQASAQAATQWTKTKRVVIGIRAEDIGVSTEPKGTNPLLCRVTNSYAKRTGQILLLQPLVGAEHETAIKVELSDDRVGQLCEIYVGIELWLSLPVERIFVFADYDSGATFD